MTIALGRRTTRSAVPDLGTAAIVARLTAFLSSQLERPVRIEAFTRLTGGLSWITAIFVLRVTPPHALDGHALVVRIGPPYGLLAPYATHPQVEALRIFADSADVPVPKLFWHGDDPEILGAPFLITSKAEGAELNPFVQGLALADGDDRTALGEQFADILGAIHAVQPGRAGGRDRRCGAEQVEAWQRRYEAWAGKPYPVVELAASWLRRHSPAAARAVVVHGDYRIGNFLVHGGRISAVLDWEMMHVGDPHEDLAWAMLPELKLVELMPLDQFIARYQQRSGLKVLPSSLRYYRIFVFYKLVLINLGSISGMETDGRDLRMACMGFLAPLYLKRLAQALEEVL